MVRQKTSQVASRKTSKVSSGSERLKNSAPARIAVPVAMPVVGIGASAGGFEAFSQLLTHLPANTGMTFIYIQHLDPRHESILPELLTKASRIPVRQASDGMRIEKNHVYTIPPNANMMITDGTLKLSSRMPHGLQMPIDQFFRSLAEAHRSNTIGIILSGTGTDGALGIEAIKGEGGFTFAQEEGSAKYPGMPHSAIATGCVDFVLRPEEIANELARISRHPYVQHDHAMPIEPVLRDSGNSFSRLLRLFKSRMNVDFSAYRPGTLKRRIARRMALRHIDSLHEYVRYLEKNSKEAESLYEEILIKVTSFFRDPGTFEALKTYVFGPMLENRSGDDPVRIWVPGCSTGEEAYSIVMALLEYLGKRGSNTEIQMFATDISETSLQKARAGLYLKNIEGDISPERLRRFFVNVGDKYQISKTIRELCIFARQNMVRDPPFSRLDLISCRNVMIYLEPMLQRKLWPTFHYALKTGGYLMLGNSETIGSSELFSVVEKPHRIYAKKQAPHVRHMAFMMPEPKRQDATEERADVEPKDQEVLEKLEEEADRLLLKYAPAAVVINQDLDIVQFRGRTGAFLEAATGRASFNLIKMAKEGLLPGLRAAIQEAKTNHAPARREGIRVKHNGGFLDAAVEVVPITKAPHSRERYFMILFEDLSTRQQKSPAAKAGKTGKAAKHDKAEKDGKEAARLRSELAETKEYLQSIIEEQEVTNEELKSANEELLSANEELQSTNEERETAREELQSINEELTTVNEELQTRNLELATVNNDLVNLLKSVNVPILMLGGDLRIRRVTAMAEKVLNLLPTDIGRPITDIQAVASIPKLKDMMLEVLDSITPKEMETQDSEGRWYSIRIRPYRTGDNKIDGVVISFIEITDLKRHAAAMTDARDYAESIVDTVRQPLLVLNHNLIVQRANAAFYNLFRTRAEETEGRRVYELGNGQWDIPRLRTLLEDVLPHHTAMQDVVVEHDFPIIGRRSMVLNARRIESSSSRPELILLGIEDVTGRGS